MNLVEHARRELEILGCSDADIEAVVSVVKTFSKIDPPVGNANFLVGLISELLRGNTLTPISDEPDEWAMVSEVGEASLWRNIRNPRVWSRDGGRTYWDELDRVGTDDHVATHRASKMVKH